MTDWTHDNALARMVAKLEVRDKTPNWADFPCPIADEVQQLADDLRDAEREAADLRAEIEGIDEMVRAALASVPGAELHKTGGVLVRQLVDAFEARVEADFAPATVPYDPSLWGTNTASGGTCPSCGEYVPLGTVHHCTSSALSGLALQ